MFTMESQRPGNDVDLEFFYQHQSGCILLDIYMANWTQFQNLIKNKFSHQFFKNRILRCLMDVNNKKSVKKRKNVIITESQT